MRLYRYLTNHVLVEVLNLMAVSFTVQNVSSNESCTFASEHDLSRRNTICRPSEITVRVNTSKDENQNQSFRVAGQTTKLILNIARPCRARVMTGIGMIVESVLPSCVTLLGGQAGTNLTTIVEYEPFEESREGS